MRNRINLAYDKDYSRTLFNHGIELQGFINHEINIYFLNSRYKQNCFELLYTSILGTYIDSSNMFIDRVGRSDV